MSSFFSSLLSSLSSSLFSPLSSSLSCRFVLCAYGFRFAFRMLSVPGSRWLRLGSFLWLSFVGLAVFFAFDWASARLYRLSSLG